MTYLKITIETEQAKKEVLIAILHSEGFESFVETTEGLEAYIPGALFNQSKLTSILKRLKVSQSRPLIEEIGEYNWNEEWERNFDPVFIAGSVVIRAPFHKKEGMFPFDILIHPKMTFGTGHHETTRLMIEAQLNISHRGKRVLDIGTGTGILSILAAQSGASSIDATDTDERCIENSKENFILNRVENYTIHKGVIEKLTFEYPFDILLANINKNVLVSEIGHYKKLMAPAAVLILSGFYEENVPEIVRKADFHGLKEINRSTMNKWACLVFKAPDK